MDANKILHRFNLRGLVKCKVCNHFNGIRANACKNKSCKLSRIEVKRKPKPKIHAVQLITNDDSKLFSVQTRERDTDNRNFVSITDKIISSDADGSIISRSAICYVDTCKYDSNDVNISCKHVKSSLEYCSTKAKVLKIELTTLNSFQLNDKEKQKLCKLYEESAKRVPLVQRINQTVFVVRCDVSLNFPAGLLHVICNENSKGVICSCACKRMKILMSSDQVIVEKNICEHLILVFMAILSDLNLKQEFKFLCSPEFIPMGDSAIGDLQKLLSADVVSLNNKQIASVLATGEDSLESTQTAYDDNLTNTTIATIDNLDNIELIQIPHVPKSKNPNELTIDLEDEDDLQSIDMETIPIVNQLNANEMANNNHQFCDGLELIKIVDQFEVEDQIEFRDGETITTDIQQSDQYFQMNGMYDMTDINYWSCDSNEFSSLCHNDTLIDNNLMQPINSIKLSSKVTTSIKASTNTITEMMVDIDDEHKQICNNLSDIQLEMYSNWLNSVIERLNATMDYNGNGCPEPIILSIPHLYFDILRAKFSAGTKKKRLPNHTIIIADGKYKGLTLFCWIFSNIKLVKYIFSTTTMQLETVQSFTKTPINTFRKIEANETFDFIDGKPLAGNNQLKRIRPNIYRTFLKVKNSDSIQKGKNNRHGLFSVEWIPNALPKSQYGEFRIKIQFGHMKNDTVIVKE